MNLPINCPPLSCRSVGIIMSGCQRTINYGVIVSNQMDKFLAQKKRHLGALTA